jgi:hypothetical protein
MNAPTLYGRRQHDFDIPQCIVELIRGCPAQHLTPEKFKYVVNALVLLAEDFDKAGWYGYDSVADGLTEASGCLDDVRGPGHEQEARDEEQRQRDMRRFMFEGYR